MYKFKVFYDPAFDSAFGRFFRAIGLMRRYECDEILYPIPGEPHDGMIMLYREGEDAIRKIPLIQVCRVDIQYGAGSDSQKSLQKGKDLMANRGKSRGPKNDVA